MALRGYDGSDVCLIPLRAFKRVKGLIFASLWTIIVCLFVVLLLGIRFNSYANRACILLQLLLLDMCTIFNFYLSYYTEVVAIPKISSNVQRSNVQRTSNNINVHSSVML